MEVSKIDQNRWFISWKIPSITGSFGGSPTSGNHQTTSQTVLLKLLFSLCSILRTEGRPGSVILGSCWSLPHVFHFFFRVWFLIWVATWFRWWKRKQRFFSGAAQNIATKLTPYVQEGFHKWEVPPNHPFVDGIFHDKPSILGYPHDYGTTQIFIAVDIP